MRLLSKVFTSALFANVNRHSKRSVGLFYFLVLFCLFCISSVQEQLVRETFQLLPDNNTIHYIYVDDSYGLRKSTLRYLGKFQN